MIWNMLAEQFDNTGFEFTSDFLFLFFKSLNYYIPELVFGTEQLFTHFPNNIPTDSLVII